MTPIEGLQQLGGMSNMLLVKILAFPFVQNLKLNNVSYGPRYFAVTHCTNILFLIDGKLKENVNTVCIPKRVKRA